MTTRHITTPLHDDASELQSVQTRSQRQRLTTNLSYPHPLHPTPQPTPFQKSLLKRIPDATADLPPPKLPIIFFERFELEVQGGY